MIEKFGCPDGAFVVPESLEILFEGVGSHRFQVDGDKFLKFGGLIFCTILRALEQASATAGDPIQMILGRPIS